MLKKKLRLAQIVWTEAGVTGLIGELKHYVYDKTENLMFRRDLSLKAPDVKCEISFQLRKVTDETFQTFKAMPPPFPRHGQYRFVYGQKTCYGAYIRNEIKALIWLLLHTDNHQVVNRWRYLLRDEVRIADYWVDKSHRGTGLIDASMEQLLGFCAQNGKRYAYVSPGADNEPSKRLCFRRGFTLVGTVKNYRWAWQNPGSGIYFRDPLPRPPLDPNYPKGEIDLPDQFR